MKHIFTFILFCLLPYFIQAQLNVGNNTNIVISNGANLVINDLSLITGNTSISGDGKVILSGSSTNNTITANSSINNLSINKIGNASVKLQNNLNLIGVLELVSGKLDLNGSDLDLGFTGALLGENESNYITGNSGFIIREATLNAPSLSNPGNIGLTISSSSNLGITTIRRGTHALTDGSDFTVKRFFDVIPTNNTNLNASIRFNYLDAELGMLQENQLQLISSENAGTTWNSLTNATINTTNNNAEVSGLSSLNRFSLANNFTTLPITSLFLTGKKLSNSINLKWETIGEINVSHFCLQKSIDGITFTDFFKTNSMSSVKKDNTYEFEDKNPFNGVNYYRVKSIDNDGETSISSPIAVNFDLGLENSVLVYPNPTSKTLFSSFYSKEKQLTTLQIISMQGKIEIQRFFSSEIGLNNFSLDVSKITSGTYLLKVSNKTLNKTFKFIKN